MAELRQLRKEPREAFGAALHLVQDAVQARRSVEALNAAERNQAEEAKARLAAIVESSEDAIISKDLNGVITSWNGGAERLFGYTAHEAIGRSVIMLIPSDRLEEEPKILERLKRGEPIEHFETVRLRKDGSSLEISLSISPIKNSAGQVIGASKIARDITARKQAENTLRALTQELAQELAGTQLLQQTSTLLIQGGDIKTLYEQILDAATAIMRSDFASMQVLYPERGHSGELRLLAFRGYSPEAAAAWEWIEADHPTTCGVALRTGRRCIVDDVESCPWLAGTPDLVFYRQSGVRSLQSTPLFSRTGEKVGMISTGWRHPHAPTDRDLRLMDVLARQAADLIERTRAEQKLRESEAETRHARDYAEATLRTSPVALLVLEKDLRIKTANEAFYKTFHMEPARTVGCPVFDLGNGQWDIPKLRELLQDILPSQALFKNFEVTHHFEAIGRRTLLFNARRMENETGTPERIVLVIEDITERKRAEEALALAQAQLCHRATNLEALVAERTARLQDTIAELEHFSYTITHDMRAPLRAMQGFAGMLLEDSDESLPPAKAECLKRIIEAARRMDALIRDSLQYAKVVREQPPLGPVQPGPILHAILRSYPALQFPRVDIQVAEPLPAVMAAETGLAQCFSNLLINAIKFVKPGITPQIRIWAEAGQASDRTVRLWFADNGIGIPPEYHSRIFEMFQQLDKSYEGTGIGLALVRKTVERMKGKVGVESEPGKGSRFWLEFTSASHA